jgi:hypothetical protein
MNVSQSTISRLAPAPFAEGAAPSKAGQVAAAVGRSRRKSPAEAGLRFRGITVIRGRATSRAGGQFAVREMVSVTTIRISTCDFWATNKTRWRRKCAS